MARYRLLYQRKKNEKVWKVSMLHVLDVSCVKRDFVTH